LERALLLVKVIGELVRRNEAQSTTARQQIADWAADHVQLTLILVAAIALALDAVALMIDPPALGSGGTGNWWPLVLNVANGKGYTACYEEYFPFCAATTQETAQREPLPVLLFAAIAVLTHESLWAASIFQIMLHIAILIGVFYIAAELTNKFVALLAALIWAVYVPGVALVTSVVGDLLATLCLTGGLFLFMHAQQTRRSWAWVTAGLCFGLAALSRSVILAIAAVLAVTLIPRKQLTKTTLRQLLLKESRPVILFAVAFIVMLSPWVIRNYFVYKRLIIGTTLAGYNLYRHNAVIETENYLHYVGPDEARAEVKALMARRTDLHGTEDEAQMDLVYREEAIRIITADPFRYVTLSAYRFLQLWFDWSVRENYGDKLTVLDYLMLLQQGGLLILAVVGIRPMWRQGWPLAISSLVVILLHMAIASRLRFLVVGMPMIIILSAVGAEAIGRRLRSERSH
jgi:4-amino-4-deoxy-L-arabinose transferase-like glycosyltransferase